MDARYGAGWAWDDYLYSYQVAKSAMPIYGNMVAIEKAVDSSLPTIIPNYFQQTINDTLGIERTRPRYKRTIHTNQINLEGQLVKEKGFYQEIPFLYSDTLLIDLLSRVLNREVYLLTDKPLTQNKKHTLYSIATDSVYQLMMEDSDNFVAEQLLLLCANEVFDKKISQQLSLERLQAIFPEGGESGTIKEVYGSSTKPFIYAKTGTLSNRHCLSGYLFTKSGKVLIFSFMHNNYIGSSMPLKKEMDTILRNLYENY